ncbi:hypothetical protein CCACVL1_24672 [Corchorus capsularis]|uniref:Uncharacterized protein n=1 Tax=Corchorus capsularis TaxID=210143 RepID=A0A1R3GNQ0_COCAP|nr:hypothetical protein CCACVL1_24672 [Corchorus capsularis]
MSSLAIFFLLFLSSLHACNARRLISFVAEDNINGNQVDFLAKDTNKLNMNELVGLKNSITKEFQEVGRVDGTRTQESWIGASAMKQTLLSSFLKAKEAFAKVISGLENNYAISSGVVEHLEDMEKVQGSFKRVTRSMLGNSASDTKEAVDSKEKENVGDVDVMDYAQPHRKPPIHNEKS